MSDKSWHIKKEKKEEEEEAVLKRERTSQTKLQVSKLTTPKDLDTVTQYCTLLKLLVDNELEASESFVYQKRGRIWVLISSSPSGPPLSILS